MLVANNETSDHNLAWVTEKSQGPFRCPSCQKAVILRKGKVRAHHFAHKPPISCAYGAGESQQHLIVKRQIYEALVDHPLCSKCALERPLNKVRPDVSLYIGSVPVAIEVQKSVINIDEIARRTQEYTNLGIYLLWVLPDSLPTTYWHYDIQENVHRIKTWEKYIHSLYGERLYYWQQNAFVCPHHFESFSVWREYFDYGEPSGTFYRHTLKTLRTIDRGEIFHIASDFMPFGKGQSKLWIDTSEKWW